MNKAAQPERQRQTRGLEVTVASQRRKQIVEAARACITEEGVERLTLRGVAERAQVSHATIAYYFHTRQELVDAALLEASEEFMGVLRQRELVYGPQDLVDLVETFLDPASSSARFVVQMIDAGLHDLQLRGTHEEFVQWGRERIEKSIRVGIDMGLYRGDVDPQLAAALLHTILIWWQSELAAEATSRELALSVGRLALKLLEPPESAKRQEHKNGGSRRNSAANGARSDPAMTASTEDSIEASLLSDPRLSAEAARTLAVSFKNLYRLAVGLSEPARK